MHTCNLAILPFFFFCYIPHFGGGYHCFLLLSFMYLSFFVVVGVDEEVMMSDGSGLL